MSDVRVAIPYFSETVRDGCTTVFRKDAPDAKEGDEVMMASDDGVCAGVVTQVTPFSVRVELQGSPAPMAASEPGLIEVQYATTIGGYVLIHPETKERLCTPHALMSDMGKIAQQNGWAIISKGEE